MQQAGRRLESAPGPPWSAVEYSSTHPHDVTLRLASVGGNTVVSRCNRRLITGPRLPISTERPAADFPGRVARGSVHLRKVACRSAVAFIITVQGHRRAHDLRRGRHERAASSNLAP